VSTPKPSRFYHEGSIARRAGKHPEANPYNRDAPGWQHDANFDWRQGWQDVDYEYWRQCEEARLKREGEK
jgi:hypothetical protein